MTYIASYFHAFSSMGMIRSTLTLSFSLALLPDQAETVSRRIEKFAELMQSVWLSRNDYERRVKLVRLLPLYFLHHFYGSIIFSSSTQCAPKSSSGHMRLSMAHTKMPKPNHPPSRRTRRARSVYGSLNAKI